MTPFFRRASFFEINFVRSSYNFMRKWIALTVIGGLSIFLFGSKKGKIIKNVGLSYVVKPALIDKSGNTIASRSIVPEGFTRKPYKAGSFQEYVQNYPLKSFGANIINYDGTPYIYQQGHFGILEIEVPSHGLQQCADALIRIRAEYLWDQNRQAEIGFNFTSGDYCSWQQYAAGYRPKIHGNKVEFNKSAASNFSKENFYRYLDLIYTYAGTISLFHELPAVNSIEAVEVGDMLIYAGSPGHVIMVADVAVNSAGEKLFIFAQGNTPAQSVHLLKNPNDLGKSPWYELEIGAPLEIPTYSFDEVKFVRFK